MANPDPDLFAWRRRILTVQWALMVLFWAWILWRHRG